MSFFCCTFAGKLIKKDYYEHSHSQRNADRIWIIRSEYASAEVLYRRWGDSLFGATYSCNVQMKEVVYTRQALLQFEENVKELVEQRYFSEEDYAVDYMREIFRYFALNLQNSVRVKAPTYFDRYKVDGKDLYYVRYRKSYRTTWYAFFEELEKVYSIAYLGNNQLIGHRLEISL